MTAAQGSLTGWTIPRTCPTPRASFEQPRRGRLPWTPHPRRPRARDQPHATKRRPQWPLGWTLRAPSQVPSTRDSTRERLRAGLAANDLAPATAALTHAPVVEGAAVLSTRLFPSPKSILITLGRTTASGNATGHRRRPRVSQTDPLLHQLPCHAGLVGERVPQTEHLRGRYGWARPSSELTPAPPHR